jgi:predicted kinase
MLMQLLEFVVGFILGILLHKRENLTDREWIAKERFLTKLPLRSKRTEGPLIIAIVGLVGSGKSFVADRLAEQIGATVIEGDGIRIQLRRLKESYEKTRAIAEDIAIEIINRGSNVILDSDFVDFYKRASLREKARQAGVRVIFIRTHCDIDIALGRMITAPFHDNDDDFFGGAKSAWKGSEQSKGAVVKIREMWRRTPHHYTWVNQRVGRYELRKFHFPIFATIDTTDSDSSKQQIEECGDRLLQ